MIKKKMLVFCPYYFPHIGGLESHADEFNKYISKKGYQVTVFTPRLPSSGLEKELRYKNVKIIRFPAFEVIPNWFLPKFWQKKFWTLFRDLYKKNFDIVISRTRFFITSLMALIYSKKRKIKWIHIEHGSDHIQLTNKFYYHMGKLYDHVFGWLVFKMADKVVANSIASAEFCKKIYKKRKYHVIYRGIESTEIDRIKPNKELLKEYKNVTKILYIGRLISGKGVRDLLKAVSFLKTKKYVLFIVGDGPQRESLHNLGRNLKISKRIIFFGQKNRKDLIGIVKASDIVVNPSYTEGLPTSVIEAVLCGKMVIATDVGGTREILTKKTGILIPIKEPIIISEKIEYLIKNKNFRDGDRRKMKEEIKKKFGWKQSIDQYLSLIKQDD